MEPIDGEGGPSIAETATHKTGPHHKDQVTTDRSGSSFRRHPGAIFREAFRRGARDALARAALRLPECRSALGDLADDYELASDD